MKFLRHSNQLLLPNPLSNTDSNNWTYAKPSQRLPLKSIEHFPEPLPWTALTPLTTQCNTPHTFLNEKLALFTQVNPRILLSLPFLCSPQWQWKTIHTNIPTHTHTVGAFSHHTRWWKMADAFPSFNAPRLHRYYIAPKSRNPRTATTYRCGNFGFGSVPRSCLILYRYNYRTRVCVRCSVWRKRARSRCFRRTRTRSRGAKALCVREAYFLYRRGAGSDVVWPCVCVRFNAFCPRLMS